MIVAEKAFYHRLGNHGTTTKSRNGDTGRHATAIGKPANQCPHWRYITQSQSAATEYTITKIQQPQLTSHDTEPTDKESTAPATGGHHPHHTRAHFFQPMTCNRCGKSEENDGNGKNPDNTFQCPVVSGAGNDSKALD